MNVCCLELMTDGFRAGQTCGIYVVPCIIWIANSLTCSLFQLKKKKILLILSPHHLLNMKGDNELVLHFLSVYIPFLRKAGMDGESLKSLAVLVINTVARLFSVVCSSRTRGSGHKLEQGKFHTNMRKNIFTVRVTKHWNRLPREAVESPSLEILKTHLDIFLCNML